MYLSLWRTHLAEVELGVVGLAPGLLPRDEAGEDLVVGQEQRQDDLALEVVHRHHAVHVQQGVAGAHQDVQGQLPDGVQPVADHQQALPLAPGPLAHRARHLLGELQRRRGPVELRLHRQRRRADELGLRWVVLLLLRLGLAVLKHVKVDPRKLVGQLQQVRGRLAHDARGRPRARPVPQEELEVYQKLPVQAHVGPLPRLKSYAGGRRREPVLQHAQGHAENTARALPLVLCTRVTTGALYCQHAHKGRPETGRPTGPRARACRTGAA